MGKTVLVSLISDQTIPNIQLIKQFKQEVDLFLCVTTEAMEEKGCRSWIEKAAGIDHSEVLTISPFSFYDIVEKLRNFDFSQYKRVIVNLTGGTKITSLATFDFFKDLDSAEIYYLTGKEKEMIKLLPVRDSENMKLGISLSLEEYLTAYGFTCDESEPSAMTKEFTRSLFEKYISSQGFADYADVLTKLRSKRNRRNTPVDSVPRLCEFLEFLDFPVSETLSQLQVKYLTGEWFEEYVGDRLRDELGDSLDMRVGIYIRKDQLINGLNQGFQNEMDVLFMLNSVFYSIECKTSVFDVDELQNRKNILGETIYKSDSLKQKFGLFAKTYIFILDSISDQKEKLKSHLERAELSRINIIDRDKILHCGSFCELLNIRR